MFASALSVLLLTGASAFPALAKEQPSMTAAATKMLSVDGKTLAYLEMGAGPTASSFTASVGTRKTGRASPRRWR